MWEVRIGFDLNSTHEHHEDAITERDRLRAEGKQHVRIIGTGSLSDRGAVQVDKLPDSMRKAA